MPHRGNAEARRDNREAGGRRAADRLPALVAVRAVGGGLDAVDGVAHVQSDVIARADKVLEGGVVSRVHVVAVLEREVLLRKLVDELQVAVLLAVRVQLGDLLARQLPHPVRRPAGRQTLRKSRGLFIRS